MAPRKRRTESDSSMTAKKLAFSDELLSRISIILVETRTAGNIGAAARAMKNMGLSRLKLVAPRNPESPEIRRLAGSAFDLVERAEVHSDFWSATAGESLLVATTSARGRSLARELLAPRSAAGRILQQAQRQNVGIVFGPERSGLTDSQLAACDLLVSFPAHEGHPVLNLAQTVLLLSYEIYTAATPVEKARPLLATHATREQMFTQMEEVLIRIGFLSSSNPDHIMNALRSSLGGQITPRGIKILRGLLSHIDWYAQEGYKLGPDKVRKP